MTEITATLTIQEGSEGEIPFERTETYENLPYPDVGPNARYENVFCTETVQITFDIADGPEQTREYSGQKSRDLNISYNGSIEIY